MKQLFAHLAIASSFALGSAHALAADVNVQFDGGIGVDPVSGISAGAPVLNTVQGVPPGGRPWVIRKLRATVFVDGSISAKGSGLLLAGGDAIGTRAAIAQVMATLFCGTDAFNSPAAALDAAGNFSIKGTLSPTPPSPCASPVLLIRSTAGAGAWFAAGIPGGEGDD